MKNIVAAVTCLILLTTCQKDDLTPSWLIIDEIQLQTDEATQGPNSHGITDAWVYMDNESLGVFSLPARIPILAEGEHDFTIYAGVKVNGISATRTRYPFYERFDSKVILTRNGETNLTPVVTYKSNVQFQLLEDFEDIGIDFEPDPDSDTNITIITATQYPDIVKYGNSCGMIYLSGNDTIYKGETNTNLLLPRNQDLFVEIDYMNTNTIAMGVIAENSQQSNEHNPLVIMNAQNEASMEWKKIYIDIEEDVSYEINATSYEIFLLSIMDAANNTGVIYLDNIKVLRYD